VKGTPSDQIAIAETEMRKTTTALAIVVIAETGILDDRIIGVTAETGVEIVIANAVAVVTNEIARTDQEAETEKTQETLLRIAGRALSGKRAKSLVTQRSQEPAAVKPQELLLLDALLGQNRLAKKNSRNRKISAADRSLLRALPHLLVRILIVAVIAVAAIVEVRVTVIVTPRAPEAAGPEAEADNFCGQPSVICLRAL
jgi:hypothetical protein